MCVLEELLSLQGQKGREERGESRAWCPAVPGLPEGPRGQTQGVASALPSSHWIDHSAQSPGTPSC